VPCSHRIHRITPILPARPRLPRFLPLQRLPGHGERRISPAASHAAGSVCALRVSHPLDALLPPWPAELISSRSRSWGLTLRGFQPPLAPCSFSDCQHPQGFCTRPLPHASRVRFTNEANACDGSWYAARPAGVLLARGNRCSGLGYFTRLPASVPPWACPFKASCPSHRGLIFDPLDCVPHALFRFCRKLTETPAPQGSQCEQRRGSLSRHP
jgi:hypothetical protein